MRMPSLIAGLALAIAPAALAPAQAQDLPLHLVPKAACGPTDRVETVQGQVTLAERFAPGAARAFNCNLELVGQYFGEGAGWGFGTHGTCAFYDTSLRRGLPAQAEPGTVVVDVKDPRAPRVTSILGLGAMENPSESLNVSSPTGLLVSQVYARYAPNRNVRVDGEAPLDIYDISNCADPVLISSTELPGFRHHNGRFSADGSLFVTSSCCGRDAGFDGPMSTVYMLNLSDPKAPKEVGRWQPPEGQNTHFISFSLDGTRAYAAMLGGTVLVNVLDVSDFKGGAASPEFRSLGTVDSPIPLTTQDAREFQSNGRTYLYVGTINGAMQRFKPETCGTDQPNGGIVRLYDVTDTANVTGVAGLMLEVHDPRNCLSVVYDPTFPDGGYGGIWCDLTADIDPKLMACAYQEGGLRVFDIRDVTAIREVAYYKPPATRGQPRLGGYYRIESDPVNSHSADALLAAPEFRDGGREIWFTSNDNAFQVVRFAGGFVAENPDLFD